jgi:hypothetical protein
MTDPFSNVNKSEVDFTELWESFNGNPPKPGELSLDERGYNGGPQAPSGFVPSPKPNVPPPPKN